MKQSVPQKRVVREILNFLRRHEYDSGYVEGNNRFLRLHRCDMQDDEGFHLALTRRGVVHAFGHGCFSTPFRDHSTTDLRKMLEKARRISCEVVDTNK
jgi:hypothetical protein